MYVCICHSVTDREIKKAVRRGVDSLPELQTQLKVGTCCGKCKDCARQVLNEALSEQRSGLDTLVPVPA
jgi:bacterioferritin-associated ferredoxin